MPVLSPSVATASAMERRVPADIVTEPRRGYEKRPEIQLLRAVAVLAVVFNHLAPGLLPGGYVGVDIFFVISGYLISAHLLRELDRSGRVRIVAFWGRRVRRLLPASLLVLFVSAVASVLVIPATQWQVVMRQIIASALYVQNWVLAHDSQDYFASADSPSPVTHYWSLSLEEQFYLVWPLVAFAAYALGRRWGRPRAAVFAAFGVVVVASLAYSVVETARVPSAAYFVTPARMWQLGIGGLLALVPALVHRRHVISALGWVALLASILMLEEGSPVPGWITLIPVLGTAAVIWSGNAFLDAVPRVLQPGVAVGLWIGAISYSLYLWHWPAIVLGPYATGEPLTPAGKLLLLAAILVVSWLSLRFVEDPVRRSIWLAHGRAWATFVPAAVCMGVVVMVGTVALGTIDNRLDRVKEQLNAALASSDPCFAARAIANGCDHPHQLRYEDSPLLTVKNDEFEARWGETCMQNPHGSAVVSCQFGVPREASSLQVALVGDSHARHWNAALEELAVAHGWNVTVIIKGSCPINSAALRTRNYPEYIPSCRAWNRAVVRRIADDETIDVVITSTSSRSYIISGIESRRALVSRMEQGYQQTWRQWTASGKKVVVIGDVPRMLQGDLPSCVSEAGTDRDPCTAPAQRANRRDPLLGAARAAHDPDIVPVDLSRFFCGHNRCHAVIGGVVAYGDDNHLLTFFSRSLAPYLDEELRPVL